MKIKTKDIKTSNSGVKVEHTFGVKDLGMIFDILRNKMYKDPIKAICREITANARDAHREAGKPDVPIEVHFPNSFDNHFKVKDYGIGISPDRVENVFVNYGASTKREDNIQHGGFGLGAKTPFSYTDTFSIISIHQGVMRQYTAYIDETEIGKMSLVSEEDTDEPDGTTIIVPVKDHDWHKFANEVPKVTKYWDVRPEIFGADEEILESNKVEFLIKTDKWALLKGRKRRNYYSSYYDFTDSCIVIDGIRYDLDLSSVPLDGEQSSFGSGYRNTLEDKFCRGFVFYFDVGELTLAASRDNIHYDDDTKNLIKQRIKDADTEVCDLISQQFEDAETYKEACQKYIELSSSNSIASYFSDEIKWGDYIIYKNITIDTVGKFAKMYTYENEYDEIRLLRGKYNNNLREVKFLDDETETLIYHNDRFKGRIPRYVVNHIFEQNPNLHYVQVILTPDEPTDRRGQKQTPEYNFELLKLIGAKSLKEIDVKPSQAKTKTKTSKPKVKKDKNIIGGYTLFTDNGKIQYLSSTFKKDDSGIYLKVDYTSNVYYTEDVCLTAHKFNIVKSFLDKEIYGFSEAKIKMLGSGWITLKQAIIEAVKNKTIDSEKFKSKCNDSHFLYNYRFENIDWIFSDTYIDQINNSLLEKYATESKSVKEYLAEMESCIKVISMFDFLDKKYPSLEPASKYSISRNKKPTGELGKMYMKIKKTYPLLPYISERDWHLSATEQKERKEAIIAYINSVDIEESENEILPGVLTEQTQSFLENSLAN